MLVVQGVPFDFDCSTSKRRLRPACSRLFLGIECGKERVEKTHCQKLWHASGSLGLKHDVDVLWLQPLHPSTKWFPNCHGATVPPPHHHQLQPEIGTGLTSRDAIWVGRYWSMGSSGIVRDRQGCCLKIYVIVSFFWRIFLSLPINLLLCKHDPSTDFKILHELWNSKFGFKGSLRFGIVWDISWYLFSSLRLAKEAETSVDRTMAHFGPGGSGAQLQILFLFR